MANNPPRLAHVSSDEDNRPRAIRGPKRPNPPRHFPPRTPDIQEMNVPYEFFFGVRGGFTWEDINRFARLEGDWPIESLPRSVYDGASLRLFVWAGDRPTPQTHWQHVVTRLGYWIDLPAIREFFLRYTRAVHEPAPNNISRRYPLCASQILCFPVYDHGLQECPFRQLSPQHKFFFLCVNLTAYCYKCNSRSITHYECKPLPCKLCDSEKHTTASGFCNPGVPTEIELYPEEALRANAQTIRRQYYQSVRERAQQQRLKYRLPSDSPYANFRGKAQPILGRIRGLHHYVDTIPPEFPPLPDQAYTGAIVEYPHMVNPEFFHDRQNRIPRFDLDSVQYLETIGEIVTEIRRNPASADTIQLPQPPAVNRRPAYARRNPPPLELGQIQPVQNQPRVEQQRPAAARVPAPEPTPVQIARPPMAMSRELYDPTTVSGRPAAPLARTNGTGRGRGRQRRLSRTPPRPIYDHPADQTTSSNQVVIQDRGLDLNAYSSPSAIFRPESYPAESEKWSDLMNHFEEEESRANSVLQIQDPLTMPMHSSPDVTIREQPASAGQQQVPASQQEIPAVVEQSQQLISVLVDETQECVCNIPALQKDPAQ
ncbi:hypothetical protein CRE_20908 [Caenorhabditis remanei]|uniref:Uncharacterized protein n=1 Tax=Caenorhabditis remanei TaxID=31234 RepID=E3N3R2_CAERE|nr:hypothetical protein CRE_20908 [Caenorhabditis remanei]